MICVGDHSGVCSLGPRYLAEYDASAWLCFCFVCFFVLFCYDIVLSAQLIPKGLIPFTKS